MQTVILVQKVVLCVLWVFALAAWTPLWQGPLASWLRWLVPLMAVAHVGEFFFFRGILERAGGSLAGHFVKTVLFGVLHISPLKARMEAAPSS